MIFSVVELIKRLQTPSESRDVMEISILYFLMKSGLNFKVLQGPSAKQD